MCCSLWPRGAPGPRWGWGKLALVAVALASLYAVTDEFHQSFVPGRMWTPLTGSPIRWGLH